MNSADVLVKFRGDTKDLDTKTKNSQNALKGFGKVIGAGLGTAAGIAATALTTTAIAIGNLTKSSVEAYAEFEQLEGGLISMLGKEDEINRVLNDSEEAYHTLTLSQNDYLNAFESSYALVKNGLKDQNNAIDYTNKVLQLSSDLYNTYGKSTEYYQGAIEWALKGTFSYLDNLHIGIIGTKEGFVEAANASGLFSKEIQNVNELTNEDIINVIQKYAENAGAWGKTQAEASDTIIGSLNQVKATWENFVAGLAKDGADIDGLIDNLVNSVITFSNNIIPVIIRAIGGISSALPTLVEKIGEQLPTLLESVLPNLVQAVINLVQSLVQNLPQIIDILFKAIIQISVAATKMLPQILNAIIVAALMIIDGLAKELPNLMPIIVEAIMGIIPVLIENTPLFIKVGIQLLLGLIEGILTSIPQLVISIWDVVKSIINVFKTLPERIVVLGKDLILGLWNGIKDKATWVIDKIKGLGKSIIKAAKKIFGIASPSKEFAKLGEWNIIGLEKGMEDMQPELQRTLNSMFDLQPTISGSMSNTLSPNLNVVVNNNMEVDPLGQVVNRIKTFSGGAKNDYNWGATQ